MCDILRDNCSPTIQIVGCNEKLPSAPLISRLAYSLERSWAWFMTIFAALMGSRIVQFLNSFVSRFLLPFLSVLWAFFATMWPSNDPALEQSNQPRQNEGQQEEVRYVQRIDTGGQRRCRFDSRPCRIQHADSFRINRFRLAHRPFLVCLQGCHRLGNYRPRSAPVSA